MPDLTKKESAYFIAFALAALAVLLGTLWLWAGTQETCWDKYDTEQAAIEACEQ
jgi:hypothetical protein